MDAGGGEDHRHRKDQQEERRAEAHGARAHADEEREPETRLEHGDELGENGRRCVRRQADRFDLRDEALKIAPYDPRRPRAPPRAEAIGDRRKIARRETESREQDGR